MWHIGMLKCFNQNFWLQKLGIANISNISTSISRFDFYVCVFTLGDHTSYYLCVCKTWGLNFNHFNQWHFHQPPVMVPYYSHTTSHKNLFKIWEFLWESSPFLGVPILPGSTGRFFVRWGRQCLCQSGKMATSLAGRFPRRRTTGWVSVECGAIHHGAQCLWKRLVFVLCRFFWGGGFNHVVGPISNFSI